MIGATSTGLSAQSIYRQGSRLTPDSRGGYIDTIDMYAIATALCCNYRPSS